MLHQTLQAITRQRPHCAKHNQQSDAHMVSVSSVSLGPDKKTPGAGRRPGVISPFPDGSGELHRL
jgi:hypothetical protein